ncbi:MULTISPECIES: Fpg/Nei family DNA glycosylase [unclassified Leptospira]|uniref:Fpg/Nei family DNA glycosylase n=1 Tax=unclassified Leptospira TaxID=2633828 RepID=UPI0002BEA81E|nr:MULTISPECIES: DNA-formamidopyrimidine glycosylase family protein [unclassified Leptospira]EMJ99944.1 putative DNA-formamidopyrimidine glycosylase [Leptospira sp. B5-022]MCR1791975.1 DNA-formamidopyrimidine glycosylase [Leptospira sp. id769339]
MPELPDLVVIRERLLKELPGEVIQEIEILDPLVVRNLCGGKSETSFIGSTFESLERTGPFLNFKFGPKNIVIHPMLAGRFSLDPKYKKKDLAVRIKFQDKILNYADDVHMGKVYFTEPEYFSQIPKFTDQGVDLLSENFTLEEFLKRIEKNRQQTRVFLMDQTKLSAIGNAYADEILFDSKIHPKTPCNKLSEEEKIQLYQSIKSVLNESIDYIRKKQAPLDFKVRDHVKVRNRKNEACPRCGTTIRRANVLGHDSFFCPNCQRVPGEQFIDWNKTL